MGKSIKHIRLEEKYGPMILSKAIDYFIDLNKHCTIVELENKCIELTLRLLANKQI